MHDALIAGRYQTVREMARGGMGTVWVARDIKLDREVALKVMSQELASMPVALQRFEREAKAVAQLRSAHIVEVYDYGLHEGVPYMVMELLVGENLGQRIKRLGRLSVDECRHVLQRIAKGLKAAHEAGLVHRDLKPNNIFVARRDDEEIVKLLDFGVVKAADTRGESEATATGVLLGTPQYMSPEQARGRTEVDHRSDLWSLAVVLFRCLTGINPFRGGTVGDVVLKICSDALPALSDHSDDLPPELDGFFERAFTRDPDGRFQSAMEMNRAFERIASRHKGHRMGPPSSRRPSTPGATPTPWSKLMEADQGRSPRRTAVIPEVREPAELGVPVSPAGAPSPQTAPPPSARPAATVLLPAEEAPEPRTSVPGPPASLPQARPSVPRHSTPEQAAPGQGAAGQHTPRQSVPGVAQPAANMLLESTPVSTTVGGTQLPQELFPVEQASRTPLALVVAGAAAVLVGLVGVVVWMGSSSNATPGAASQASNSPPAVATTAPSDARVRPQASASATATASANATSSASASASASSTSPKPPPRINPVPRPPRQPPPPSERPKWF